LAPRLTPRRPRILVEVLAVVALLGPWLCRGAGHVPVTLLKLLAAAGLALVTVGFALVCYRVFGLYAKLTSLCTQIPIGFPALDDTCADGPWG
jgi:hypothetical protein